MVFVVLVCSVEVSFQLGEGRTVCEWFLLPVSNVLSHDTRFFEDFDGFVNDRCIGNRLTMFGSKSCDLGDVFPDVLNWLGWRPFNFKFLAVLFDVTLFYSTVGSNEMVK